jgi:hypothetical protein
VSFGKYGLVVAGILTASLPVLLAALAGAGADARRAALLGALLAALNTLAAYGLVLWSAGRSTSAFMRAILGGMVGRMAVLLAAVVAAVLWLGLPKLPLALSLLGYFVVFLVLELGVVHKRTTPHPEAR